MLRTIVAIVAGLVAGSAVNMGLVSLGGLVVPTPQGLDVTDAESIAATSHLLQPQHFLFPFLAHALGTLIGALVAYLIAVQYKQMAAGVVGGVRLAGGIAAAMMIPAPIWFLVVDLGLAYLPMAWLAIWLGKRLAKHLSGGQQTVSET